MINYKNNLNTKNIWEFTTEDTIYIPKRAKSTGNDHFFLCQFKLLNGNTVYGTVLEVDKSTSWDGVKVGDTISNDRLNCALYGQGENESNSHLHNFTVMGYAYEELGYEETEKTMRHPSFGLIGLSRITGSNSPLFGSNIQHQNVIRLRIKKAEHKRHLNNDWYHGIEEVIEIDLSGAQYAELISTFNSGEGIPCTIRSLSNQRFPDPPYENPVDIFQREFASKMNNLTKDIKSLVEDSIKLLKDKPTINKADREFIMRGIERLVTELGSNVPFVSQQFIESMEKTVSQAKSEFETFINNRITSLGLDALKDNPSLFLGGIQTKATIEEGEDKNSQK